MAVGLPVGLVRLIRLVAPGRPVLAESPTEHFEIWTRGAGLDQRILLVGLSRMLTLSGRDIIHLRPSWTECPGVFAPNAEQNQFGHVSEIEPDPAAVGTAVLSDFVPDDVRLVCKSPFLHHLNALRQEGIWDPEVEMALRRGDL